MISIDESKALRRICCGMDVHKKEITASVATFDPDGEVIHDVREFTTFNKDLLELCKWLQLYNCKDVLMESTGKYWIPIFNILESQGLNVSLTHPKYVRNVQGQKNDRNDCKHMAEVFLHYNLRTSFIPPPDIRFLRTLCRYRYKLNNDRANEKRRYQDCLTVSNIALASVLSDSLGKTGTKIVETILEKESYKPEDILPHIYGLAKRKTDDILKAIEGFHASDDQRIKLNMVKQHIAFLTNNTQFCDTQADAVAQTHAAQLNCLCTMPGINKLSATQIISEIGADMSVFKDARHLANWAGLAPCNDSSAGKKKSKRTMRGGAYLKPLLVQCARAACRSKKQPYFANKYWQLRRTKDDKRAIVAIARKMLVCIYHMLSRGESFHPVDLDKAVPAKKNPPMNLDSCLAYLAEQGLDVTHIKEQISALAASG